ncbi:uncharacterized protein LOC141907857 [Tubulanus polymorphus]|uniref:uncharacterized protein LOC141907857 n=1 Tax=Tubulanus polymorphus TaxID=672921 RepID=UPI003DA4E02A
MVYTNISFEDMCFTKIYGWLVPITFNLNRTTAYAFPVLSLIGLIIIVLGTYKKSSTSCGHFYMMYLGMADLYAILGAEVPYLMDIAYVKFSRPMCIVKLFHANCPKQIAVWILVLMTVDRAVAVSKPLQAATLCTVARAKKAVAIVSTILAIINIIGAAFHEAIDLTGQWTTCMIVNLTGSAIYSNLNNTLALFLPFLVVAVANGVIIVGVRRSANMDATQQVTDDRKQATAKRITVLVISTSLAFLVLSFLAALTIVLEYEHGSETYLYYFTHCENLTYGSFMIIGNSIGTVLYQANHMVNAYIFLCSRSFRNDVKGGVKSISIISRFKLWQSAS